MDFSLKGFATIRIMVSDVAASRDWYRSFFGKEPVEDEPGFASFKLDGAHLDLVQADGKNPLSKGGSVGYWHVSDLDAALARAKELGGELYRGPLRVEEIQRNIAQIQDPFGNVIGLEAEF